MRACGQKMSLEAKLNRLECHFTWNLACSKSRFLNIKDHLEDIGPEEAYMWLGHINNLLGFIHFNLGHQEHALKFFSKAAETFRQIKNTVPDEGPWLLVNYGDLAWLHFHMGEQAECQSYLTKVEELLENYPSLSQGDFHQEVYAEKAWNVLKFEEEKDNNSIEFYQKAIRLEPDRAEWHSSYALALNRSFEHSDAVKQSEILEKMRIAKEHDPDNLYLATIYLVRRAETDKIMEEARELAKQVLRKPIGSYSGLRPLLRLYRMYLTFDEAIDLAKEALERNPNKRYLKDCLATAYKWKIFSGEDTPRKQSLIDRAICLFEEVIQLYPESCLRAKLSLASIYAESNQPLASHMYEELVNSQLDAVELQMIYNSYAKYLHFHLQDQSKSIDYHMKTAEIPYPTRYRANSINLLIKIAQRGRNRRCSEIQDFLDIILVTMS